MRYVITFDATVTQDWMAPPWVVSIFDWIVMTYTG